MNNQTARIMALGVALALACGCSKKNPNLEQQPKISSSKNQPAWVNKCAGAFPDAGKNAFYGCGTMSGDESESVRMSKADAAAKADLAQALDAYNLAFFREFLESPKVKASAGLTNLQQEQLLQVLPREVTQLALYGVQVRDRWLGPDGAFCSLAFVQADILRQALEKQIAVRAPDLKLDPDDAVDELDRQLEKYRQKG